MWVILLRGWERRGKSKWGKHSFSLLTWVLVAGEIFRLVSLTCSSGPMIWGHPGRDGYHVHQWHLRTNPGILLRNPNSLTMFWRTEWKTLTWRVMDCMQGTKKWQVCYSITCPIGLSPSFCFASWHKSCYWITAALLSLMSRQHTSAFQFPESGSDVNTNPLFLSSH